MSTDYQARLGQTRAYWDDQAATFDTEADHGLRDPAVRDAWKNLLRQSLPLQNASVLDIGCGTGSLSLILAELGHQITGIDISPAMIARAQAKFAAAGFNNHTFLVMDAAYPQFPAHSFDAILCRHLLWALEDQTAVLERWQTLLKPAGRLILIEGFWFTGGGLRASTLRQLLPALLMDVHVENLSDQTALWGRQVTDERYMLTAKIPGVKAAS